LARKARFLVHARVGTYLMSTCNAMRMSRNLFLHMMPWGSTHDDMTHEGIHLVRPSVLNIRA